MKKYMSSLIIIGAILLTCIFFNASNASAVVSGIWEPGINGVSGVQFRWNTYWLPLNVLGWEGLWDATNGHWEYGPYGIYGGATHTFTPSHNGLFKIYSVYPPYNPPITYATVWFN